MKLIDYNNDYITKQAKDFTFTSSLITNELSGIYGSETLKDMKEIIALYAIYSLGVDFEPDNTTGDYVTADHKFKIIKSLIDKEARFLFSNPPTITLEDMNEVQKDQNGKPINRLEPNEALLDKVLQTNHFNSKLVRAAKDCL